MKTGVSNPRDRAWLLRVVFVTLIALLPLALLALDVANTHLVVEHEYPKARIQDRERLTPILRGSLAFVRRIDEAAACLFALQHEVLPAQGIAVQGIGREPFRS